MYVNGKDIIVTQVNIIHQETTGIADVKTVKAQKTVRYNLAGQQVDASYKGVVIENGKKFVIEARENSKENVYIQSGELNGQSLDRNFITYGDITRGGRLVFQMGSQPNRQRNTGKAASPFSMSAAGE